MPAFLLLIFGGILLLMGFLYGEFEISVAKIIRLNGTNNDNYSRFIAMILGTILIIVGLSIHDFEQIELVLENFSSTCEEWNADGNILTASCYDPNKEIHESSLKDYGSCDIIENINGELECKKKSEEP